MRSLLSWPLLTLFFALGCSGTVSTTPDTKSCTPLPCPYPGWDPDTCSCRSASDGGNAEAGSDSSQQEDAVADSAEGAVAQCSIDSGDIVAAFKVCHQSSDCTVAVHEANCCGTMILVGVAQSDLAAFAQCEQAWEHSLPGCGCMSGPTTAEDGNSAPEAAAVVVECTEFVGSAGVCKTRVP